QGDVGEHPRPEAMAGVIELEAYRGRTRDRVEGGRDQRDAPREHLAREGRNRRVDPAADLDAPELVLEDLGNDPDTAQVGDLVEDLPLRDVLTFVDDFSDHVPADRSEQREELGGGTAWRERVDLVLAYPQHLETLGGEPDPFNGVTGRRRPGAVRGLGARPARGGRVERGPDRPPH